MELYIVIAVPKHSKLEHVGKRDGYYNLTYASLPIRGEEEAQVFESKANAIEYAKNRSHEHPRKTFYISRIETQVEAPEPITVSLQEE